MRIYSLEAAEEHLHVPQDNLHTLNEVATWATKPFHNAMKQPALLNTKSRNVSVCVAMRFTLYPCRRPGSWWHDMTRSSGAPWTSSALSSWRSCYRDRELASRLSLVHLLEALSSSGGLRRPCAARGTLICLYSLKHSHDAAVTKTSHVLLCRKNIL